MRRRDMLFGLSALPLAASCASAPEPAVEAAPVGVVHVPPVLVSPERIIETVVGLRPYRRGGFRFGAEPFLGKTLVHNYGHGGDGVSLSWGCSLLAADYVKRAGSRQVAVLGAGVMGLTTALILAREGYEVTIYAEDFPPNTTSNIAGALILTDDAYGHEDTPHMRNLVQWINAASQNGFLPYVGRPGYGVKRVDHFFLGPEQADHSLLGRRIRRRFEATMVDPGLYLQAISDDVRAAGAVMYSRRFAAASELAELPQQTIVNCTGLGAGALFLDSALFPIRGQLTLLTPQPEIDYTYITRDAVGTLYMFPRESAIVLGGSREAGDWSRQVYPDGVQRMLREHGRMAARAMALA